MTDAPSNISYVHVPDLTRYEIRDGDVLAGFTEYVLPDDVHVDFVHTEVDEAYGGPAALPEVPRQHVGALRAAGQHPR